MNDIQYFDLFHFVFRVDDWFLMSSVWPTVGLCGLYYYIIRIWGPRFMKDREPYNIQTLITAYNLFQTLFSLWIWFKATKFWLTGTRQLPSRDLNMIFAQTWHFRRTLIFKLISMTYCHMSQFQASTTGCVSPWTTVTPRTGLMRLTWPGGISFPSMWTSSTHFSFWQEKSSLIFQLFMWFITALCHLPHGLELGRGIEVTVHCCCS